MSRNKNVVPEARAALDKFKMEAASEVGVNLKQGYNGDLTSKKPARGRPDGQEYDQKLRAEHEISFRISGSVRKLMHLHQLPFFRIFINFHNLP